MACALALSPAARRALAVAAFDPGDLFHRGHRVGGQITCPRIRSLAGIAERARVEPHGIGCRLRPVAGARAAPRAVGVPRRSRRAREEARPTLQAARARGARVAFAHREVSKYGLGTRSVAVVKGHLRRPPLRCPSPFGRRVDPGGFAFAMAVVSIDEGDRALPIDRRQPTPPLDRDGIVRADTSSAGSALSPRLRPPPGPWSRSRACAGPVTSTTQEACSPRVSTVSVATTAPRTALARAVPRRSRKSRAFECSSRTSASAGPKIPMRDERCPPDSQDRRCHSFGTSIVSPDSSLYAPPRGGDGWRRCRLPSTSMTRNPAGGDCGLRSRGSTQRVRPRRGSRPAVLSRSTGSDRERATRPPPARSRATPRASSARSAPPASAVRRRCSSAGAHAPISLSHRHAASLVSTPGARARQAPALRRTSRTW